MTTCELPIATIATLPELHRRVRECRGNWLFCDGGVIWDGKGTASLSTIGGPWAWVLVRDDVEIAHGSGVLTPKIIGLPAVSNNVTELYAMLRGLSHLPPDWRGTVVSDSKVTLCRRFPKAKMNNVPEALIPFAWQTFKRALAAGLEFVLVDGHPSPEQLAEGRGKRGQPVSKWNNWCHHECDRLKEVWS